MSTLYTVRRCIECVGRNKGNDAALGRQRKTAVLEMESASTRLFGGIIVIDDSELITKLVRHHLTREGYDVLVAGDGPAGLKLAEECSLLCMDTGRRMTWTRNELLDILSRASPEIRLGAGDDEVKAALHSGQDFENFRQKRQTLFGGRRRVAQDLQVSM